MGKLPLMSCSVLSGKGGVGKTSLTLNLALALGEAGHRVLVLDGDIGLANLDLLLDVTPEATVQDVMASTHDISSVLLPVRRNVDIIPSASGQWDQETADELDLRIAAILAPLLPAYDILLLDLGAGIAKTVLRLARLTHVRLLVTTPEPTSLTDGYALVKLMHMADEQTPKKADAGSALARETGRFRLVVNKCLDEDEYEFAAERLAGAAEHFLSLSLPALGMVPLDESITESVCSRTPLLEAFPKSPAAQAIRALARSVLELRADLARRGELSVPLLPDDPVENKNAD